MSERRTVHRGDDKRTSSRSILSNRRNHRLFSIIGEIGDYAFVDSSSLGAFVVPDSVTEDSHRINILLARARIFFKPLYYSTS